MISGAPAATWASPGLSVAARPSRPVGSPSFLRQPGLCNKDGLRVVAMSRSMWLLVQAGFGLCTPTLGRPLCVQGFLSVGPGDRPTEWIPVAGCRTVGARPWVCGLSLPWPAVGPGRFLVTRALALQMSRVPWSAGGCLVLHAQAGMGPAGGDQCGGFLGESGVIQGDLWGMSCGGDPAPACLHRLGFPWGPRFPVFLD